ncbi:MAG: ATP-binding protein [Polyangiales bacterium]
MGLTDPSKLARRAVEVLASFDRDFTFVELYLLDRDGGAPQRIERSTNEPARGPVDEVAHLRAARLIEGEDGALTWLTPLESVHDVRPWAVLMLGLHANWDAQHAVLDTLARQLGNSLHDPRLARERSQDELTRTLFHQSPVAICVAGGPSHRYLLANRSYMEMVNKHDLIGRSIADVFPEIVGTPLLALFDHVYMTGESYVTDEYVTALDRDGDGIAEECFFRFNLVATRDPSGQVWGWTCTAADISAQVRARREAQHARQQAEEANRAKDEFLAMLGHELRNPLAPITTSLYLMEKQGDDRFVAERTTIQRQVDHLVNLVDDLLDVSRITSGKVRLQKRPVELSEVVHKAIEQVSTLLFERAQQLAVHVPAQGLLLHGDLNRLAQVVCNLLTNAAKYSPDGSQISIDAQLDEARATLTVRDVGMGISAEMLPRVFALFVQERQALDRARGGLGIGLAIVRGIVRAHGGEVHAFSDGPGRGSAFVVELPLASEEDVAAANAKARRSRPPPAPAKPLAPTRVLVVDDNRDAALTLAQVLRGMGHQVEVAFDGMAALQVARDFGPALALLDIGLPVLDGYALAERLRLQQGAQRVRMVAVTGYGQAVDRERAFAAGFDAHVVKPLRIDAVESIFEDLQAELEHRRA